MKWGETVTSEWEVRMNAWDMLGARTRTKANHQKFKCVNVGNIIGKNYVSESWGTTLYKGAT